MSLIESLFPNDESWRTKLDWANNRVINETGLTREKLKEVLEHLEKHGIIKSY
jgi:hypothetical protein